jgi:hypothetical protein
MCFDQSKTAESYKIMGKLQLSVTNALLFFTLFPQKCLCQVIEVEYWIHVTWMKPQSQLHIGHEVFTT